MSSSFVLGFDASVLYGIGELSMASKYLAAFDLHLHPVIERDI